MEPPPTLEELVKKVGISLDLLDQKCSDEHLDSISLLLDWRRVAPHLGLSKRDIEDIKVDKRTEDERRLAVLRRWKMKYGYQATLKTLVVVLLAVGDADTAERVCHLLQTPAGEHSASTATVTATAPTTPWPGDHQHSSPVTAAEASLCSTAVETSKVSIQHSESDIDREIEELERQFLNVESEAAKDLRTVKLSKVKLCLTQPPASVKYRHIKFLEHNLSAIASATSVDAILALLFLHVDFMNPGLIIQLVRQLGSHKTKLLMEQYMEKLRQFRIKTKLGDFFDKWAQRIPPHFSTLVTEMGEDWRDRTLEDLEDSL